ncbi:response regulator [Geomonas subterranea]|uniref:response regulator n=1 Tax=Geomonas subterranea TaxID=2847989 RepID=UPI001CD3CFBF|nr:response regulator [Geomonas fuzhouensis]
MKIKRILVVDDQDVARKVISSVMEKHGHVDTAADGHEALKHYVTAVEDGWLYDLVCMDITMPGLLNGYQAVRCIRAHEETSGITKPVPVVMISSHTDLPAFAKEMDMTVDDYITKPFSQSRLEEVIQRFLY